MSAGRGGRGAANKTASKKQDSAGVDDIEPCDMCSAELGSTSEALQCDKCKTKWACIACLGLQKNVYKALNTNHHVLWLCQSCKADLPPPGATGTTPKTPKAAAAQPSAPADIASMFAAMMQQLQRMESKLDAKADAAEVQSLSERVNALESQMVATAAKPEPQKTEEIKSQVEEAIDEYREREARKLNLVIFNLPESEKEEVEERRTEDTAAIKDLISLTGCEATPTKFLRLGARNDDRIRPVKLELESTSDKWKILKGARKLKDTRLRTIGIAPDLSKKQRTERKQLKEEIETRKAQGEENLMIRRGRIYTNRTAPNAGIEQPTSGPPNRDLVQATAAPPATNDEAEPSS